MEQPTSMAVGRTYTRWSGAGGGFVTEVSAPRHSSKWCHHKNYGLSCGEYDALYERADGGCEICRVVTKLVIDHCHESGMVRGLLCFRCNWRMSRVDGGHDDAAFYFGGTLERVERYLAK